MESIYKNEIDLLSPSNGDVYIVAYPKAGVTWVTELVTAIYREYARENPAVADSYIGAVRAHAFCDVCPMSRRSSSVSSDDERYSKLLGFDANGNETFGSEEEAAPKRIISLHFPAKRFQQMMPEAFTNPNVKLIYVARNPKDIAVSYYHFHQMNDALPTPESWEEFLDDFNSGNVRWGSWFDHVRGWKRKCDVTKDNGKSQILWLTFESLKKNLKSGIKDICQHLGLTLSDRSLNVVFRRCSFASMKADPVRNHSRNNIFKGDFLRKGQVGDWQKQFTVAQSKEFDRLMVQELDEDFLTIGKPLIEELT